MTLDELEKLCSHESYSVNDGTGKWATVSLIPGKMQALIACARELERIVATAESWDRDSAFDLRDTGLLRLAAIALEDLQFGLKAESK